MKNRLNLAKERVEDALLELERIIADAEAAYELTLDRARADTSDDELGDD